MILQPELNNTEEIAEDVKGEITDDAKEEIPEDDDAPVPEDKGNPVLVVIIAVAVLAGLSLLPWAKLTDNQLKGYNLLSDILPTEVDSIVGGEEFVDPDLLALMQGDTTLCPLSLPETLIMTTVDSADLSSALPGEKILSGVKDVKSDATPSVSNEQPGSETILPESKDSRIDGKMIIEDYTPGGQGLSRLKSALSQRNIRPVRIGVVGDSYIEGDIFTSDIRRRLQEKYGGHGVGYMAANSQVAGFRPTVKHTSSGWTHHDVREAAKSKYFNIAGEYYTGAKGATIKFTGVKNMDNVKSWNTSQLVFVAPAAGSITLETDTGTQTFDITPSDEVQAIKLPGETTSLKVTNNVPGLVLLGAWLNDSNGVVVDCMSVRGDSGVNRRGISTSLASELRPYADYDLIVVEYGINALSSKQKDYTTYSNTMVEVIKRIKQCYPNADIILMGIGDRGQKIGGEAHSFATAPYMVEAQRAAARKAGVMFYDTRESMGGEGAIVKWRNDKLANGDYIHLNFNGGKVLADTFVDALLRKVSE